MRSSGLGKGRVTFFLEVTVGIDDSISLNDGKGIENIISVNVY